MSERSILRVRDRQHVHPDRREERVVEVVRNGEVVAFVYGSREGIHIVSARLAIESKNKPMFFQADDHPPSYIVPLLADEEPCPWCEGTRMMGTGPCMLCVSMEPGG